MMTNILMKHPRFSATLVAIYPLLSLVVFGILMASGGNPDSSDASEASGAQNAGGPPLIVLFVLLAILVSKGLAVAGNFRRWYYGWVFHLIELNLVLFLQGLFLVIAVLSFELALASAVKLILMMGCLYFSTVLKSVWCERNVTDRYRVTYYTHA